MNKDRKVANKKAKEQQRQERDRARIGMMNGEEKYLTRRDKGPQRRYIRNYVDARFSVGEIFIPAAILILVIAFTQPVQIQQYFTYAVWGLIALIILDAFVLNYILKNRLRNKFGSVERGITFYAVMRSIQLRPRACPSLRSNAASTPSEQTTRLEAADDAAGEERSGVDHLRVDLDQIGARGHSCPGVFGIRDSPDGDYREAIAHMLLHQAQHLEGTFGQRATGDSAGLNLGEPGLLPAQHGSVDRRVRRDEAVDSGAQGELADLGNVVIGEVGGDLDQQRHVTERRTRRRHHLSGGVTDCGDDRFEAAH